LANVPAYNTDNISLGPGILFIGASGTTPTVDVGAIHEEGMTFTVTREYLEVFQGSPKTRIINFVTQETAELTMQTLEWKLENLPFALGAGVTTSSGSQDTFSYGGDSGTKEVAVRVQHTLPTGHTISILMWRAQPSGEWELNMTQDDLQSFPFSFRALTATQSWDGAALASNQQLFRIIRDKA
jgi:hypothetical protein